MILLAFTLDDWNCALHISTVERAYRAVAITPMPGLPEIVLGIVNVKGVVLPVVNIRKRFNLPEKDVSANNHLLVAHTAKRSVALVVDNVVGVVECPEQKITTASTILPGREYIKGVCRLKDGMILIQDLARFLSLEEEIALERAMEHV